MLRLLSSKVCQLTVGVGLCAASVIPVGGAPAQASAVRYVVKDLGTLGGSFSTGDSVNDLRWVAGASLLPGNTVEHATLWFRGFQFDLGTPGGLNSTIGWPVHNDHGLLPGIGEISASDPLGENFCHYGTGLECRGFAWEHGIMTTLSTLGGNNGQAAGANNRDFIVGWAEDTTMDPTCTPPQVLQFEAVVWNPFFQAQVLPPLPGDPDGAAVAINNRGQVVGISGPCAGDDNNAGRHAVLWQNGTPTDLGNLGGTVFNVADAINDRGEIAGFSALPGNMAYHAFFWTSSTGIKDLGTLPGDVYSQAFGINNRGQVVGGSCDANFYCRAFIWQHGVMRDLNALIRPLSPLYLTFASDINQQGDIAGSAYDQSTGIAPAFMATPKTTGSNSNTMVTRANRPVLPERVRAALRLRSLYRGGAAMVRTL